MPRDEISRYELVNIGFVNWYLFVVQDIPVHGSIAIVGHNGAGKSSIIDGMQVALTGNSRNAFRLNAAAQEKRASERTVRSYCLGTMAPAEGGRSQRTAREDAVTYILLGFRHGATGAEVTVGICMSARSDMPDEKVEALFVAKGRVLRAEDVVTRGTDEAGPFIEPLPWPAVAANPGGSGVELLVNPTAELHVRELCHALSPGGLPVNHRKFLRTLRAGLRFNPETIESATNFVRTFILDAEKVSLAPVRQSIETYRTIQARIEEMVRRLDRLQDIRRNAVEALGQTRHHRRLQLRAKVGFMAAEHAAGIHEAGKAERAERQLLETRRRIAAARSRQEGLKAAVDGLRAAMATDAGHLRLRSLDLEEKGAELDIERQRVGLTFVGEMGRILPPAARIAEARRAGLVGPLAGLSDALSNAEPEAAVPAILAWNAGGGGAELAALAENLDRLVIETERLTMEAEQEVDALRANIRRLGEGKVDLKPPTLALMRSLDQEGIEAVPLCERVVRVDPDWQRAVEALLGDRREALLVPPESYTSAFRIQRRLPGRGGRIINTTRTGETRPARGGSVAELVEVEASDIHARAFLDYVLGGVMQAETPEEFAGHENALTRDLMVQGGRVSGRLDPVQDLKLGLRAEGGRAETLAAQLAQAEAGLEAHRRRRDEARAAFRVIEQLRDAIAACGTEGTGRILAGLLRRRSDLEGLRAEREDLEAQLDQGLRTRLAEAERALAEIDGEMENLLRKEGQMEGAIEAARAAAAAAAHRADARRAEAEAMAEAHPEYLDENAIEAATAEWQDSAHYPAALAGQPADLMAAVNDMAGRMVDDALKRRDSTFRAAITGSLGYWQEFDLPRPEALQDLQSVSIEAVVAWLDDERTDLEENRLLAYRKEAATAHRQAMDTFRNEYVRRMHDAFNGMRQRLSDLNRQLRDRDFHGYRYAFDHIVSRDYKDFVDLVNRASDPTFDLPLFGGEGEDPVLGKALKRLTDLAADPAADMSSLEDPGLYFTYEIQLYDIRTGQRLSLSSRLGTASGGESQAPYYIAIGSAFCSTYQGRSPGEFGMALTMFDEAFSKLDGRTVRECSAFLGGLGLQVIMAAPDEKRLTFLGIADTIVSVNRDDMRVQLDIQHPRRRLRDAIAAEDPRVKGLEGFRAGMTGESPPDLSGKGARREAAE